MTSYKDFAALMLGLFLILVPFTPFPGSVLLIMLAIAATGILFWIMSEPSEDEVHP